MVRYRLRAPTRIGPEIRAEVNGVTERVFFDALLSEDARDSNIMSKHPRENGTLVNDHVQRQQGSVTLVLRVSNTPLPSAITQMQSVGALFADFEATSPQIWPTTASPSGVDNAAAYGRVSLVYGWLFNQAFRRQPVTVITGLRDYVDYTILDVSPSRTSGQNGTSRNALDITVTLEETVIAEAVVVQVDPAIFARIVRASATGESDNGNNEILNEREATIAMAVGETVVAAVISVSQGNEAAEAFLEDLNERDPESQTHYEEQLERDRESGATWPPPARGSGDFVSQDEVR